MNTKSISVQNHSIWQSNRYTHDQATSSLQRTNPRQEEPVERASQSFQSLVNFVKEGNNLTDQGTSHACRLLRENTPSSEQAANQILFSLVPSPDNSCSGFTESMSLLLTSSNSELVKTAWWFLTFTIAFASPQDRIDFLAAGFLTLFPTAFYQQKSHLSTRHGSFLIDVVKDCMSCLNPTKMTHLTYNRHRSKESFEEIFMNKFIHPVRPFLRFMWRNRRQFIGGVLIMSPQVFYICSE